MTARDNILKRLHSGFRPASADFCPDVAAYYDSHRRDETIATHRASFRAAMEAAHAEVHDTSASGWPQKLRDIAAHKGLHTLLAGSGCADAALLGATDSPNLRLLTYDRPVDDWRSEMFTTIDAGLTRARSAIAATGSLVLWPDARAPRLLSLVPPVHFVLLDANAIHADLHQAMTAEGWARNLPTNALLISGPSKTADIQQTLAYGAHGPRELVVLIVHAEEGAA